jgi:hypothetical protein
MGVAEGCRQLDEYRGVLAVGGSGAEISGNLLVDTGLICPTDGDSSTLVAQLDAATASTIGNPLATEAASLILGTDAVDLDSATEWSAAEVRQYLNCDVLIRPGGRMEELARGNRATSLVAGVRYFWVSFMVLSGFLSCTFQRMPFGISVTWTALAWLVLNFEIEQDGEVECGDEEAAVHSRKQVYS